MKKALSILLTLVMLLSIFTCLPVVAHADQSGKCGDNVYYHYNFTTKKLTISGTGRMWDFYEGEGDVKIPEYYDFRNDVESVVIEEGVTWICTNAFDWFSGIKTAVIADSVTEIGINAFFLCNALTTVTIGTGVAVIRYNAFVPCSHLTQVNYAGTGEQWNAIEIEHGNEPILRAKPQTGILTGSCGEHLTYSINRATGEVNISGTGDMYDYNKIFETSNYSPFYYHSDIVKTVVLEEGVTGIGISAFLQCNYLTDITFPQTLTKIGKCAFQGCSFESFTFPDTVTEIQDYTFYVCSYLQSITIPASVTKIGYAAFDECNDLTQVNFTGTEEQWNAMEIGAENTKLLTVKPKTSGKCGEHVSFTLDPETGILTLSGSGKMYDYKANDVDNRSPFYSGLRIKHIVIESGITSIGNFAFCRCNYAESISIPGTVKTIGNGAFYTMHALTSIDIPDSVKIIGDSAFLGCHALESITIGSGVETLEYSAFKWCSVLKSMHVSADNPVFDSREDCNAIIETATNTLVRGGVNTVIPASVTAIGYGAFHGYEEITEMHIPESITHIDGAAFQDCENLVSIYLPKTLQSINAFAFEGCESIQDAYFMGSREDNHIQWQTGYHEVLFDVPWHYSKGVCGENVNYSIDWPTGTLTITGTGAMEDFNTSDSPFYNEKYIKNVVISNGITHIGQYTFTGCDEITGVAIPESLQSVGTAAFRDTAKLTDVYYCGGAAEWNQIGISAYNQYLLNATKHYDCLSGKCGDNITYLFNGTTSTLVGTGEMYDYESGDSPFYGESAIKNIVIGGGITRIGNNAFGYCTGLTDVSIPTTVTSIGNRAFVGCGKLAAVEYPGTQDEWDDIAIGSGNGLLTNVKPQMVKGSCGKTARYSYNPKTGVLTITGTGAMYDYSVGGAPWYENHVFITAVVIDDNISAIGANAFADCMNMTSVSIGRLVDTIGDGAFNGCDKLATVNYARTQADWDEISIGENNAPLTNIKPQYGGKCGANATYHFDPASGTLTISGSGAMEDYGSAYPGYYGLRESITAIQINEGITHIGNIAFYNLQNVESVSIPTTVTSIGRSAFQYCYGLTDVYYAGAGMEWDNINIGAVNDALEDATMHFGKENILTGECGEHAYFSLNLDTNTLAISGSGAMYDYEYAPWDDYKYDIFTIVVESGITAIGNRAFEDCAVNDVSIAGTVTFIGNYALSSCDSLSAVEIPSSVAYIGEGAFTYCTDLTSVEIPAGITGIEKFTFMNCTALQSITIPASVSRIDEYAFDGCTALETVNFGGTDTQWDDMPIGAYNEPLLAVKPQCCGTCGANLTYRLDHTTGTLYIEGTGAMDNFTSTSMPWYAFKEKILKVNVANGVTIIGENAFWNCKTIEDVTLGNTVQKIAKYAFGGCESLESINLPNSLTSIGGQAFGNCKSLESIAIPSGVTSLATSTFASCTALKTITLPTTLTKIGAAAFSRCFGLQTVGYAGTQDDWNAVEILDSNDPLLAVKPQTGEIIRTGTCGENVSYILNETTGLLTISGTGAMYDYAFGDSPFNVNQKVKEIVIESGVTTVGDNVFTQLLKLEKVSLPSTVTSIGKDAFAFCFLLADINIPESVQSIGEEAFSACYALTSITIPKGVKTIGKSTFWHCDHLQSVTLPKSLESVADNAFVYCSALTDVFYEGTASDWNAVTISTTGNDPLLGATMHYGATDFAAIRYKVPAFNGTNTTLTFKSESMSLTVSAADGNFEKDNVQSGVYKVYAKQKNALTIYLGKYDTASGAVTNTGAITLPLGDVNKNDCIDIADISMLLSTANYGKHNSEIDLTGDGMITIDDISVALMATNYGMSSVSPT